ncbi:YitT family protein [Vagococcus intermedius]|uniref:YitT family protein n=1 Tax=Vagococcus intermedius TaxID=2991418 RepID=A0AAF0CT52_9ENTE|nr:YitT family protein [Vagococcus intermedius]WEG72438.1 YitT family protein [Vagococcus intermedius]WEG74525.1 YitT family protein [Vagococcus intermedius]
MKKNKNWILQNEVFMKLVVIVATGLLSAVSLNMFLIPANVFSAGLNGIAQLVSSVLEMYVGMSLNTGLLIFLLNIPVFILSWLKLGKSATVFSFLTVISMSVATMVIPQYVVTTNPLMNAIVGGVLVGVGAGFCLKLGFTTGGLDIIALVIAKTTGKSVGNMMFSMNLLIILLAGTIFSWESALYTIISIYCLTQVIDTIHTGSQKVTAFIISSKSGEVVEELKTTVTRGMTLLPSKGGFSNQESSVIMMVVSRYELFDLEKAVYTVDPNAFINIVPTQTVMGAYWNEDQQRAYLKEKAAQAQALSQEMH